MSPLIGTLLLVMALFGAVDAIITKYFIATSDLETNVDGVWTLGTTTAAGLSSLQLSCSVWRDISQSELVNPGLCANILNMAVAFRGVSNNNCAEVRYAPIPSQLPTCVWQSYPDLNPGHIWIHSLPDASQYGTLVWTAPNDGTAAIMGDFYRIHAGFINLKIVYAPTGGAEQQIYLQTSVANQVHHFPAWSAGVRRNDKIYVAFNAEVYNSNGHALNFTVVFSTANTATTLPTTAAILPTTIQPVLTTIPLAPTGSSLPSTSPLSGCFRTPMVPQPLPSGGSVLVVPSAAYATLESAAGVAQDGDVILLNTSLHVVSAPVVLNHSVVISGAGVVNGEPATVIRCTGNGPAIRSSVVDLQVTIMEIAFVGCTAAVPANSLSPVVRQGGRVGMGG
jgi:hypothetical protein